MAQIGHSASYMHTHSAVVCRRLEICAGSSHSWTPCPKANTTFDYHSPRLALACKAHGAVPMVSLAVTLVVSMKHTCTYMDMNMKDPVSRSLKHTMKAPGDSASRHTLTRKCWDANAPHLHCILQQ